jgi:hypothetical protein
VVIPDATARVYRDAIRMLERARKVDALSACLAERIRRYSELAHRAAWLPRERSGFECAAALASYRRKHSHYCEQRAVLLAELERRVNGTMQHFVNQFPRMDHRKAETHFLALADCANWDEQREKYPRGFDHYTPEVWAAWLHATAAEGLTVRSGATKYKPTA